MIVKADRVDSIVVSNKDGLVAIRPRCVIDATGDADVAAWAGCPYEIARVAAADEPALPNWLC